MSSSPRPSKAAATPHTGHVAYALHNQTAPLMKGALLFRRSLVVADIPYLLKR